MDWRGDDNCSVHYRGACYSLLLCEGQLYLLDEDRVLQTIVHSAQITAFAVLPQSALFLAVESGDLVLYQPLRGQTVAVQWVKSVSFFEKEIVSGWGLTPQTLVLARKNSLHWVTLHQAEGDWTIETTASRDQPAAVRQVSACSLCCLVQFVSQKNLMLYPSDPEEEGVLVEQGSVVSSYCWLGPSQFAVLLQSGVLRVHQVERRGESLVSVCLLNYDLKSNGLRVCQVAGTQTLLVQGNLQHRLLHLGREGHRFAVKSCTEADDLEGVKAHFARKSGPRTDIFGECKHRVVKVSVQSGKPSAKKEIGQGLHSTVLRGSLDQQTNRLYLVMGDGSVVVKRLQKFDWHFNERLPFDRRVAHVMACAGEVYLLGEHQYRLHGQSVQEVKGFGARGSERKELSFRNGVLTLLVDNRILQIQKGAARQLCTLPVGERCTLDSYCDQGKVLALSEEDGSKLVRLQGGQAEVVLRSKNRLYAFGGLLFQLNQLTGVLKLANYRYCEQFSLHAIIEQKLKRKVGTVPRMRLLSVQEEDNKQQFFLVYGRFLVPVSITISNGIRCELYYSEEGKIHCEKLGSEAEVQIFRGRGYLFFTDSGAIRKMRRLPEKEILQQGDTEAILAQQLIKANRIEQAMDYLLSGKLSLQKPQARMASRHEGLSELLSKATGRRAVLARFLLDCVEWNRSIDFAGLMFQLGRRTAQQLSSEMLVWGLQSNNKVQLVQDLLSKDSLTWVELRRWGVGYWLDRPEELKRMVDKVAEHSYKSTRNPFEAMLWYLLLGKRRILIQLFKKADDQVKTYQFLQRDFSVEKNRQAAAKNAYALLQKKRNHDAMSFFLLGQCFEDAVNVAVNIEKDAQLAFLMLRLVDFRDRDKVRDSLAGEVLKAATQTKDPWLGVFAMMLLKQFAKCLELICQRPDLQQKFDFKRAGCSELGVALSDFHPSLALLSGMIKENQLKRQLLQAGLSSKKQKDIFDDFFGDEEEDAQQEQAMLPELKEDLDSLQCQIRAYYARRGTLQFISCIDQEQGLLPGSVQSESADRRIIDSKAQCDNRAQIMHELEVRISTAEKRFAKLSGQSCAKEVLLKDLNRITTTAVQCSRLFNHLQAGPLDNRIRKHYETLLLLLSFIAALLGQFEKVEQGLRAIRQEMKKVDCQFLLQVQSLDFQPRVQKPPGPLSESDRAFDVERKYTVLVQQVSFQNLYSFLVCSLLFYQHCQNSNSYAKHMIASAHRFFEGRFALCFGGLVQQKAPFLAQVLQEKGRLPNCDSALLSQKVRIYLSKPVANLYIRNLYFQQYYKQTVRQGLLAAEPAFQGIVIARVKIDMLKGIEVVKGARDFEVFLIHSRGIKKLQLGDHVSVRGLSKEVPEEDLSMFVEELKRVQNSSPQLYAHSHYIRRLAEGGSAKEGESVVKAGQSTLLPDIKSWTKLRSQPLLILGTKTSVVLFNTQTGSVEKVLPCKERVRLIRVSPGQDSAIFVEGQRPGLLSLRPKFQFRRWLSFDSKKTKVVDAVYLSADHMAILAEKRLAIFVQEEDYEEHSIALQGGLGLCFVKERQELVVLFKTRLLIVSPDSLERISDVEFLGTGLRAWQSGRFVLLQLENGLELVNLGTRTVERSLRRGEGKQALRHAGSQDGVVVAVSGEGKVQFVTQFI